MLGRVFFGCHWILDTVVGASIGAGMATLAHTAVSYGCTAKSPLVPHQICPPMRLF
jgi:membrane-associated phospholipid phosphatase